MPISTSIEVNCPSAELFAYVTDSTRFVEWQDAVVSGHMNGDGPTAVGRPLRDRPAHRVRHAARNLDGHPRRTASHWGLRGIDGPIRAEVNVRVEALPGDLRSKLTPRDRLFWTRDRQAARPADGTTGSRPGVLAGAEPMSSWFVARHEFDLARTAESQSRTVTWPFGQHSVERGLRWFSLEPLIHSWDLARAIGEEMALDQQLVHEHLARLIPLGDRLRGPGMYGPEIDTSPEADEQVRLLAFLGRRP